MLDSRSAFVLVDIGCLECDIPTEVLGVFQTEEAARQWAAAHINQRDWDDRQTMYGDKAPSFVASLSRDMGHQVELHEV